MTPVRSERDAGDDIALSPRHGRKVQQCPKAGSGGAVGVSGLHGRRGIGKVIYCRAGANAGRARADIADERAVEDVAELGPDI